MGVSDYIKPCKFEKGFLTITTTPKAAALIQFTPGLAYSFRHQDSKMSLKRKKKKKKKTRQDKA
jgi:hypothetical protein